MNPLKQKPTSLALICVVVAATVTGCFNYTGAHKEAAEKSAKKWSAEMHLGDPTVVCNTKDTDHDGYVSCNFNFGEGRIKTYECAGAAVLVENTGCREPKMRIPARP